MDEARNSRISSYNEGSLKETMDQTARHRAEGIGIWAGTLAATEIGLGSLLHGLHVPLAGTFLSLNQAMFLTRATVYERGNPHAKSIPLEISSVTAILKSFSPVGKKLTPMLAISVQGALFSLGLYLFGVNLLGILVASALLASWGIIQPLAIAGVMFWSLNSNDQQKIIVSWEKLVGDLPLIKSLDLTSAVVSFLCLKCLVIMTITAITWCTKPSETDSWFGRLTRKLTASAATTSFKSTHHEGVSNSVSMPAGSKDNPLTAALRDLRNPVVLISLMLITGLFALVNSDFVGSIWICLRALATAYISYLIIRLLPWDNFLSERSSAKASLQTALKQLSKLQVHVPYTMTAPTNGSAEKKSQV